MSISNIYSNSKNINPNSVKEGNRWLASLYNHNTSLYNRLDNEGDTMSMSASMSATHSDTKINNHNSVKKGSCLALAGPGDGVTGPDILDCLIRIFGKDKVRDETERYHPDRKIITKVKKTAGFGKKPRTKTEYISNLRRRFVVSMGVVSLHVDVQGGKEHRSRLVEMMIATESQQPVLARSLYLKPFAVMGEFVEAFNKVIELCRDKNDEAA